MLVYQRVQCQWLIFYGEYWKFRHLLMAFQNLRRKKTKSWIKDQRDPSNSMKIVRKSTRSIWYHRATTQKKHSTSSKIHRNSSKISRKSSKNLQKIPNIWKKNQQNSGPWLPHVAAPKPSVAAPRCDGSWEHQWLNCECSTDFDTNFTMFVILIIMVNNIYG